MIKHCKNCGKEIIFIYMNPTTYTYKDKLGYYCSYNCYRKKAFLKDNLINVSCLGPEKEKQIKELTLQYYKKSNKADIRDLNYKAIVDSCDASELLFLFKNNKGLKNYKKF